MPETEGAFQVTFTPQLAALAVAVGTSFAGVAAWEEIVLAIETLPPVCLTNESLRSRLQVFKREFGQLMVGVGIKR